MNQANDPETGKLIIATVGLCGVGKSEATRFLTERLQTEMVYFGGLVADEIHTRGEPVTPATEKAVREELRQRHGMDVVARMAVEPIRRVLACRNSVVLDGLYSFAEYNYLTAVFPFELVVIALHARKETRYKRLAVRVERPLSREQVDSRDRDEVLRLDKAPAIVLADYHVVNENSMEYLHGALKTVLDSCRGASPRCH